MYPYLPAVQINHFVLFCFLSLIFLQIALLDLSSRVTQVLYEHLTPGVFCLAIFRQDCSRFKQSIACHSSHSHTGRSLVFISETRSSFILPVADGFILNVLLFVTKKK